jgi:hypothetical protein
MCAKPFLSVGLIVVACLPASAPVCRAQLYRVSMDTSALIGQPNPPGPFYLDFQFTDGSGTSDGNNTARIGNFHFDSGGALVGSPTTAGGVSGDLSGTLTLTDSSFFTEYTQQFTPGDPMHFDMFVTLNPDSGAPDELSFALLETDTSGNLVEIPTTAANNAFLTVDLTTPGPSIQTAGTPLGFNLTINPPTVTAPSGSTPEPDTLVLLAGMGVSAVGLLLHRRQVRHRCRNVLYPTLLCALVAVDRSVGRPRDKRQPPRSFRNEEVA